MSKKEKNKSPEKKKDSKKFDPDRLGLQDALKMLAQDQNAALGDAETVPTDEDLGNGFNHHKVDNVRFLIANYQIKVIVAYKGREEGAPHVPL